MKRLVIGRGSVFADLLIIGEAPGAQEDLEGKPYVGKSGKLLNELLIQAGICLLYTSPSPRDPKISRMPSSAWK